MARGESGRVPATNDRLLEIEKWQVSHFLVPLHPGCPGKRGHKMVLLLLIIIIIKPIQEQAYTVCDKHC